MQKNCQILQGQSILVSIRNDQVLLCQIGQSFIGSLELYVFKSQSKKALDIKYLLARDNNMDHCYDRVLAKDSENQEYEICIFKDNSILDHNTFIKGLDHVENLSLRNALIEQ